MLFWSFRIMVGLGLFFIVLFGMAFVVTARRRIENHRGLLRLALYSLPLPWIAAELGWIVAEYGRQPWVIEGVLPTSLGVSSVSAGTCLVQPDRLRRVLQHAGHRRCLPDAAGHPPGARTLVRCRKELTDARLRTAAAHLVGIARRSARRLRVTDGFDLGVGMLFRFIGKTDEERRVFLETIEPVWEGNQVWFILGGGAIFAAWPPLYATSFSGFYIAMFLVLAALILRPVGFAFRNKLADPRWRNVWDWALFIAGFVPSLVFGVAFGNFLLGVPFRFDDTLRVFYEGSFFALLNPFAVLCGLVSVAMLAMHGATYAAFKTHAPLTDRAAAAARMAAVAYIILFTICGVLISMSVDGYRIVSEIDPERPVESAWASQ